jgi:hypothetical protein
VGMKKRDEGLSRDGGYIGGGGRGRMTGVGERVRVMEGGGNG